MLFEHIITSKQFLAAFIIVALVQPVHGTECPVDSVFTIQEHTH